MSHVYGTTLYFDATVGPDASELWAYDPEREAAVTELRPASQSPSRWA